MFVLPFTAAQAVARAKSQKNYAEQRSNLTKYGKAYGWDGVAWCGIFIWWTFDSLGTDIRQLGISAPVSTNAFDAGAKRIGWKPVPVGKIVAGDLLFFDFGDLGVGDTANDDDHVAMATGSPRFGYVPTIEGNTSPGTKGSQANGGGVYERQRWIGLVRHAYRPPYSTASQIAAAKREKNAALARARAAWAAKAVKARAAAALATKKRKAAAAAAAAALAVVVAAGTAANQPGDDMATPRPTPSVSATPTPSPVLTVPARPTPKPSAPKAPAVKKSRPRPVLGRALTYSRSERIMRGGDVRWVQVLVRVRADGEYGPKTAAAVKRWQKTHGLKADGVFGKRSALAAKWRWSA